MGAFLDSVPFSGIIRIRDMMYAVDKPFRLDQGDVSFDAPDSVKQALIQAVHDNRSHYVQTAGIPPLITALADKMRRVNGIPIGDDAEVLVAAGGIHGIYMATQGLLEPGDEVIFPDPLWPPGAGCIQIAHGVPVPCPLRESLGWRWDLDELASKITPKTRAIYINSPNNPAGGVLTREDLTAIAALAEKHGLWVFSDEAYEDVVFEGEHVSIASLPGMYERTIPIYTFSKTYAMTGLRLAYVAVKDPAVRDRIRKVLFYTVSSVSSLVQYGGLGGILGDQAIVGAHREELLARRDLFYAGIHEASRGMLTGDKPAGAFYAFMRISDDWTPPPGSQASRSWAMAEMLIARGRIGCVPGADFGAAGENYIRFCFARERSELEGALASMNAVFAG
ncbi:MAG: pyridoxal phosphate-dependent aminotransferase [Acidobacteriota bacterium]|nr:pyridoxal phosphate-dependent aminotransferase [Acidobacteriota bacterium]